MTADRRGKRADAGVGNVRVERFTTSESLSGTPVFGDTPAPCCLRSLPLEGALPSVLGGRLVIR